MCCEVLPPFWFHDPIGPIDPRRSLVYSIANFEPTPSFGYFWDGCVRFPKTLKRNRLAVVIPMLIPMLM